MERSVEDATTAPEGPGTAQDPIVKIHSHLVDIAHLARKSYDELQRHQSTYEQLYISERSKLLHNVEEYKAIGLENQRLEQENRYYNHQVLPEYELLFHQKDQLLLESQKQAESLEVRNLDLEKIRATESDEHKRTMDAMTELLDAQDEKIERLETQIKESMNHDQPLLDCLQDPPIGKRSRLGNESRVRVPDATKRSRKSKQTRSKTKLK